MTKRSKESNNFLYITTMRTMNLNMNMNTLTVVNNTLCIRSSEGFVISKGFVI